MDDCPICGQYMDVVVHTPDQNNLFVDGKHYTQMCHACFSVPQTYKSTQHGYIYYGYKSPDHLATIDIMNQDGWDTQTAKISIKAVTKLLKKAKYKLDKSNLVLEQIFIDKALS
ncbi:hypothetical protein N9045_02020 [bacterium]|nr:hypothetical protein [bacterium]